MTRYPDFVCFLLLLLLACLTPRLLAQSPTTTAQTTTAVSYQMADITTGILDDLPLFDPAFYQNQLFLLGETHGFQKAQEVDFALLRHLNRRVGVRYYVAEVDMSQAYFLNQYLKTGDDSTLMRVFRQWIRETAQWANRDFYRKIQRIRALNQTLPANRQIQFLGIDRIQERTLVAEHLVGLLTGKKLSAITRLRVDSLRNLLIVKNPDSLRANLALRWLTDLDANLSGYQKTIGTATVADLRHLLQNVAYLKTIRGREKTIVANFTAFYHLMNLHTEKLYGFWGFFHILQAAPTDGSLSMATMLRRSELPVHDKIVSLACQYVGSKMMTPTAFLPAFWQEPGRTYSRVDKFNNDGPMLTTAGIEAMKAATQPNTLTLIRLVGTPAGEQPFQITHSPFMPKEQQINFDPIRPATDYFQYIILIRNSDATEPLVP